MVLPVVCATAMVLPVVCATAMVLPVVCAIAMVLPVVCAIAMVVHWNYLHTFVQGSADLKLHDVYGAAFCNIQLAFNITLSTLRLMKEGSDVIILYFGKGTASYFAVCDKSQCMTQWCP